MIELENNINDFFLDFKFVTSESEQKKEAKREARKAGPPVETEAQIEEKNQIYRYLVYDRKVKHLVHFTPITNVRSILENGLLPRTDLRQMEIDAAIPDPERWDSCYDYSSLSVSYPNYKVLYAKRLQGKFVFAGLLLDPRLILNKPLEDISYLTDNAAAKGNGIIEEKTGLNAAKALFNDTVDFSGKKIDRTQLDIPSYYTTNPQAEVFVWGAIDPVYITTIIVETDANRKELLKEIMVLPIDKRKQIYKGEWFFRGRKDHQYWKNVSNTNEVDE